MTCQPSLYYFNSATRKKNGRAHEPRKGEIPPVELKGVEKVVFVEVGVAQLTVDGGEDGDIVGAYGKGLTEETNGRLIVARCLAHPLRLQCQLEAGSRIGGLP